jgi:hypothetical protein
MDNTSNLNISMTGLFKSLSLYLPLILLSSLLIFSIMSSSLQKFLVYISSLLFIIMARLILHKFSNPKIDESKILISDCSIGLINEFIPQDILFGTYLLSFTLFYFLTPMILLTIDSGVDSINYIIILFFMCYIFLDLTMKKQMGCIENITFIGILGNFFSGTLLGSGISALLYTSPIKNLLYVGEINSNKEVCSMPSQQKFKCSVYKNGELVSSSVS